MISAHLLEQFYACYKTGFDLGIYKIGLTDNPKMFDKNELLNNSLKAMLFFTQYAHERGGTNRNFSRYHRISIQKCMGERMFEDILLNDDNFPDNVWKEFKELTKEWTGKPRPNEPRTIGAVKNVLIKLKESKEANIIRLLGNMNLESASEFLRNLKGIKEKISALFLRDLQEYYNFWKMNESNLYLLQPVDRWVDRFSKACWLNYISSGSKDEEAKQIIKFCCADEVNPIHFNMGVWFVGSYYIDLCNFHNIPENRTMDLDYCINRFDIDKIIKAIKNYTLNFITGDNFSL